MARRISTLSRMNLVGMLLLAIVTGAGAAWQLRDELTLFFHTRQKPELILNWLAGAQDPVPLEVDPLERKMVLDACANAFDNAATRDDGGQTSSALVRNCLGIAREVVSRQPSDGYGWYWVAFWSLKNGDVLEAVSALRQSYLVAPNEQWIAAVRFQLANQMLPLLPPDVQDLRKAELAMLITSQLGSRAIARDYIAKPQFRQDITEAALTLSPDDQVRFLNWVRQAAAGN